MNLHGGEMPTITASSYASSAVDLTTPFIGGFVQPAARRLGLEEVMAQAMGVQQQPQEKLHVSSTRFVRVIIVDPNENLPLEKRILHKSDEFLTDLTDQELFFEVDIAGRLRAHNETRAATVDKKASERSGKDVHLEPARIRDLKMVVVNVASF